MIISSTLNLPDPSMLMRDCSARVPESVSSATASGRGACEYQHTRDLSSWTRVASATQYQTTPASLWRCHALWKGAMRAGVRAQVFSNDSLEGRFALLEGASMDDELLKLKTDLLASGRNLPPPRSPARSSARDYATLGAYNNVDIVWP